MLSFPRAARTLCNLFVRSAAWTHISQTRTGSAYPLHGTGRLDELHFPQNPLPHILHMCLPRVNENGDEQPAQKSPSESSTHTTGTPKSPIVPKTSLSFHVHTSKTLPNKGTKQLKSTVFLQTYQFTSSQSTCQTTPIHTKAFFPHDIVLPSPEPHTHTLSLYLSVCLSLSVSLSLEYLSLFLSVLSSRVLALNLRNPHPG
mmetsp:Transcript_24249/g.95478  ORF Transcript_24249/g.95478 Transcript_24249/m.95478 type:complete len:201 (-) Transcript_24249:34-636(-)